MKIKKVLLSFILMISMLCAVGCKDKETTQTETPAPQKTDPTVSVSVENRIYFVGEKLEDIPLILASGSTSGTIVWSENLTLQEGVNSCNWVFTPTDTALYNKKTGTELITARKLKTVNVQVTIPEGQIVYRDAKFSTIEIEAVATCEGQVVEGTISWKNPNDEFDEESNLCEWVFTPEDRTTYAVATGTVTVIADTLQVPVGIAVVEDKNESYKAFDTIKVEDLTILLVYNEGKKEVLNLEQEDVEITYKDNELKKLKKGDTSVIITYNEYSTIYDNLVVDYKPVRNPVFKEEFYYIGREETYELPIDDESVLYTYEPIKATDADEYELVLTLIDSENYIWENGDIGSTVVKLVINKIEISVNEGFYDDEFDGNAHSVSVTNSLEKTVYYYENDFESKTEHVIEKTNAGIYTINYFIEGDKNHLDKHGTLSLKISKQTPTMNLQYFYVLKPDGNVNVNYPEDYVSIVNKQSDIIENEGLRFVYYSQYSNDSDSTNDILTTPEDDGALFVGGAPKNEKQTEYYFVVEFAGSQNYNATSQVTVLYIDGSNLEFYAKSGELEFGFKDEIYKISQPVNDSEISITGSNAECNGYLEFFESEFENNGQTLKTVNFKAKFDEGDSGKVEGRLVYVDGKYQLLSEDGLLYVFNYDSSKQEITIADGVVNEVVLKKWEFPSYLKSFTVQTVTDDDYLANEEKYSSKNTTITFYNDYGTIRFSADVNVRYSSGAVTGESGGNAKWSGVAEIEIGRLEDQALCYILNCYIINEDSLESSGYEKTNLYFNLKWRVTLDGNNEPAGLTLYAHDGSLLTAPYNVLLNKEFVG